MRAMGGAGIIHHDAVGCNAATREQELTGDRHIVRTSWQDECAKRSSRCVEYPEGHIQAGGPGVGQAGFHFQHSLAGGGEAEIVRGIVRGYADAHVTAYRGAVGERVRGADAVVGLGLC